jgi:hypothetical protein
MRTDEQDDDILQDGESVKVKMTAMDAALRAAFPQVRDAKMRRPGFRVGLQTYHDARSAKAAAYADYDKRVCDAYRNPNSEGPEGAACTVKNAKYPEAFGSPGHIVNGICTPDRGSNDADFPRRKLKRNARNQEEGEEEYERDSAVVRDAFAVLARSAGLVDQGEDVDWDDIVRIACQINAENGNEDDDDDEDVNRIVTAVTTNTESTQRRDVPDSKTPQRPAATEEAYRAYDEILRNSWRG